MKSGRVQVERESSGHLEKESLQLSTFLIETTACTWVTFELYINIGVTVATTKSESASLYS